MDGKPGGSTCCRCGRPLFLRREYGFLGETVLCDECALARRDSGSACPRCGNADLRRREETSAWGILIVVLGLFLFLVTASSGRFLRPLWILGVAGFCFGFLLRRRTGFCSRCGWHGALGGGGHGREDRGAGDPVYRAP